jgi:hypothetical protein
MKADNPLTAIHLALAHAAYEGFPEFEYETRDWDSKDRTATITKSQRHSDYTMTVYNVFPQDWSSTALGFGGMGGQAITGAYTVIIESKQACGFCVYFGGRFAYRIEKPNEKFFDDIANRQMHEVQGAKKLYERN